MSYSLTIKKTEYLFIFSLSFYLDKQQAMLRFQKNRIRIDKHAHHGIV